ncbi:MAG: hypothetical protein MR219_11615, partial [Clostridiales bacterium]|nr:hypothetical protein [Clostridiales bacterium]
AGGIAAFAASPSLLAINAAQNRRSLRRCCGLHMKGLRPLHASQELKRDFFDNLRPDWRETSPVF